jgi:DNA invertase Pin-like site-specific DNA recombinase
MGELIGYARVSTDDQRLDLQLDALAQVGVTSQHLYTDKASGARSDRPGLLAAIKASRPGDVLVVWRLDRLARSTSELLKISDELQNRQVALRSLNEALDTSTASGKLIFTVFAAMAEFERNVIKERTMAGLRSAREKGRRGGRKPKLSAHKLRMARTLLADPMTTLEQVAEQMGVHRTTLYRSLKAADADRSTKDAA